MLGRQCPWGNFKWTRAGLAKLEQVGLLYGLGGHLAGRAGAHWLGGAETRLLLLLGSSRKLLLLDKLLLRLLLHKLLLRLLLDNCCQGCCCTICCCWGWATCCGWGWETSCCWLWKNWAACCWRAWNDCCCWPADTCSCCWGANLCCWGANCWGCAGRVSIWLAEEQTFAAEGQTAEAVRAEDQFGQWPSWSLSRENPAAIGLPRCTVACWSLVHCCSFTVAYCRFWGPQA